jgi:hypothetical protein
MLLVASSDEDSPCGTMDGAGSCKNYCLTQPCITGGAGIGHFSWRKGACITRNETRPDLSWKCVESGQSHMRGPWLMHRMTERARCDARPSRRARHCSTVEFRAHHVPAAPRATM